MWSILSALIGPILQAIIAPLFGYALTLHNQAQAQQLGASQAAGAEAAQTARTEAAVAQAEASAPKTQGEDVAAFDAGSV
jgi:hypothetical protein